ncbi:hypothetical protein Kpho01_22490 [Kitasatospora phosalacinea]|uniref:Uncharacterized protein n=1 Tax=Kitasatospora phosalacinea TaxID=2065 RepID=A0A9W6UNE9_9ACTN|nr:hypothetical protein Kpho01_22490 [Kitasatospora phosalacinea]
MRKESSLDTTRCIAVWAWTVLCMRQYLSFCPPGAPRVERWAGISVRSCSLCWNGTPVGLARQVVRVPADGWLLLWAFVP